jgi:peroxiredoxin Q/BCP
MLSEGDRVPDVKLVGMDGQMVSPADFRGQKLVLYFYPKDDTTGCTKQACGFNDTLPNFSKLKAEIVGVSRDSAASHDKFKKKYGLKFRLASDAEGKVSDAYGTWVEKSMYGRKYMGMERSTYLIDAKGVIRQVWRKVKVSGHIEEVMVAAKAL